MTEKSFFWDGEAVGDAIYSEYSAEEFAEYMDLFNITDRYTEGVRYVKHLSYNGVLEPSNPAGVTIQLATGVAIVKGYLYTSDAVVNLSLSAAPGAGTDYYTVVLRESLSSSIQTVRAALLGPVNGGPAPVVTQSSSIWEIELAQVQQTSAGVITIIDKRHFVPNLVLIEEKFIDADNIAATITFSGIPKHFKKLILDWQAVDADYTSGKIRITFNGDASALYSWIQRRVDYNTGTEVITSTLTDTDIQIAVPSTSPSDPARGTFEVYCGVYLAIDDASNMRNMCHWFTSTGGHAISGQGVGSTDDNISSIEITAEDVGTPNFNEARFTLYGVQ